MAKGQSSSAFRGLAQRIEVFDCVCVVSSLRFFREVLEQGFDVSQHHCACSMWSILAEAEAQLRQKFFSLGSHVIFLYEAARV